MPTILKTQHLILREFNIKDSAFIIELLNSEGWIKYIGDRNVKTPEQAVDYLVKGPMKSYKENGFGLWMVELKESQKAIGMCGLIKRTILQNIDIGFAFLPEFLGKGYGFEIATATLNYAQSVLNFKTIDAITLPENEASIKLIKKIGMTYHSIFVYPDTGEKLHLYRLNS